MSSGARRAGFQEICSIDIDPNPELKITHRFSVLDKSAMEKFGTDLEKLRADGCLIAMHASPPCQQFSIAGLASRAKKSEEENAVNLQEALEIVVAALDLMHKHADVWSLENPGTGSLWSEHTGKIKHNLSEQLNLDVCRFGSVMKKNMIIALSCTEVKDLFGEQRKCPGMITCPSVHANPGNGYSSKHHVSLNDLCLSDRIAFPAQLSLHLAATMHTYLRNLPAPPLPSRRNLLPTVLVGLASIDCFYRDNTTPSAQLTGTAKRLIQSLWNDMSTSEMQQLVKVSWDLVQEDDSTHCTQMWCSNTHIDRALKQLQSKISGPAEGGSPT